MSQHSGPNDKMQVSNHELYPTRHRQQLKDIHKPGCNLMKNLYIQTHILRTKYHFGYQFSLSFYLLSALGACKKQELKA